MQEGNSGQQLAVFTVSLSAVSNSTVSVDYGTSNSSATAGSDFSATSGTLAFAPGEVTKTFSVPILGDTLYESNEIFRVALSNPVNAALDLSGSVIKANEALFTISNDDGGLFAPGDENDALEGGVGNDTLDGGTGNDTMVGNAGNDYYYVRDSGDVVIEAASEGTDTVYSYLGSYTLGANVENGRVMSTGAANLNGNGLNNSIYAGKGDNVLAGGSSTDTLSYAYGANGTTGVKVSLATTSAQATGGSGTDMISGFERLTGSTNNDSLTGNSGANLIRGGNGHDTVIGGSGNDTLYGDAGNDLLRGGTGNDILYGGAGKDIFRFDTALGTSTTPNIDQIKDFSVLDDTIQLENAIFKSFATKTGVIGSGNFKANLTGRATDSNDYIIYETDTGKVFYDADGSGAAASVQIALVGTGLALSSADFVLV